MSTQLVFGTTLGSPSSVAILPVTDVPFSIINGLATTADNDAAVAVTNATTADNAAAVVVSSAGTAATAALATETDVVTVQTDLTAVLAAVDLAMTNFVGAISANTGTLAWNTSTHQFTGGVSGNPTLGNSTPFNNFIVACNAIATDTLTATTDAQTARTAASATKTDTMTVQTNAGTAKTATAAALVSASTTKTATAAVVSAIATGLGVDMITVINATTVTTLAKANSALSALNNYLRSAGILT